jgi:hypothetical protein
MRGTDRASHRFFGLSLGLFVVLLAALMAQATAADYIPANQPIPQNVRVVGTNSAGASTVVGTTLPTVYGGGFSNVPVSTSWASVGAAAKKFLGRAAPYVGWAMTLREIINGAGWVIDELGRQVVVPPTATQVPAGVTMYCHSPTGQSGQRCSATGAGAVSIVNHLYPYTTGCTFSYPFVQCEVGGAYAFFANTFAEPRYDDGTGTTEAVPVSNHDLGYALRDRPDVINAVLIDPDTGAPIRTPELVAAMNDLRKALEAANGAQPAPDMPTDPDWSNPDTSTPNQTQWPGFCDWATTVCEFIDWVKAPDDAPERPEVPWDETPPEPVQWSSGLGGGECPAPHQVTVSIMGYSASPSFEYTPLCTAATYLRPVLIAVATIVAAFIVAGLRQSKDA